jgi:hypothetical protein
MNGDGRILDQKPFMAKKRFFGYGTEDKDEAAVRLSNCFHHIIYAEDCESILSMPGFEGMSLLAKNRAQIKRKECGSVDFDLVLICLKSVCLSI